MLGVVTQTEIARLRGCTIEHVNSVLNGRRRSKRLECFIEAIIDERKPAVSR
ncbi:hypothetical protein H5P28_00235 [Ruficoccus amylovorans]|uniref:XRE family transcriptional regulator n=1 Tax=Ruficoccus amylovorans TaxID=1804625 RepID=A0A842H996_9BACT|nr:hypothetical protein [Ruficoccus amylovorans]MBC2592679.1 hypothetical protein [Ruficoccus amylovorans]